MARKSAEFSVFSVSALDVLTAALGTFIILAAISMPFVFNTGFSLDNEFDVLTDENEQLTEEIARLQDALTHVSNPTSGAMQQELTELREKIANLETMLKNNPPSDDAKQTPLIPPIDIVIALDTTGSMERSVNGLRNGIVQLSRILLGWSDSPAIGIVELKDECEYDRRKLLPITEIDAKSIRTIERFSRSLNAGNYYAGINACNFDNNEAVHLALLDAVRMQWREDSVQKIVVLVSDNPPYPHQYDYTKDLAKSFSANMQARVSVVHEVSQTFNLSDQAKMRAIARSGNGQYIQGAGSFVGSILLAVM